MAKNKRKIRNYLIRPISQLKISGSVAAVIIAIVVALNILNYLKYKDITRVMSNFYGLNEETREILLEVRMQLLTRDIIASIAISFLIILVWIIMTHRIYGASVAIKKFVGQMIEGKYESKIILRKKDEFKDIADLLNVLGGVLRKRHAQPTEEMK